jgi:hypothetical protein
MVKSEMSMAIKPRLVNTFSRLLLFFSPVSYPLWISTSYVLFECCTCVHYVNEIESESGDVYANPKTTVDCKRASFFRIRFNRTDFFEVHKKIFAFFKAFGIFNSPAVFNKASNEKSIELDCCSTSSTNSSFHLFFILRIIWF